jgi:hypothetical protein
MGPADLVPLLIFLVGVPCLYAAYIKLAALFLRFRVPFKAALPFGLLIVLLSCLTRISVSSPLASLPVTMTVITGFLIQIALGAWYFSRRATDSTGKDLGWQRAGLLSGLTCLLWGLTAVLLKALSLSLHSMQPTQT